VRRFGQQAGWLIDQMSQLGLILSAGLVAFLMLTQVLEVTLRSLGHPTTWVYDLNLSALLGVVVLALADAERGGEHVAVDFLSNRIQGRVARALVVVNGVVALVFLVMLAWFGALVAVQSAEQGRETGGLFSIPTAIPEALLPIGAVVLVFQTLATMVRRVSGSPRPPDSVDPTGDAVAHGGEIVSPPTDPST
jgi:TRAP-type C4-dicarboxylate transport system permease small subunit